MRSSLRQLALILLAVVALLAASCSNDTADSVVEANDTPLDAGDTALDADDAADQPEVDSDEVTLDDCLGGLDAPECDALIDSLSDEEYCELVEDPEFCDGVDQDADLDEPTGDTAEDERTDDVEPDEPEADDESDEDESDDGAAVSVPISEDADYCVENPDDSDCDEFFESLSDEEFCELFPDEDDFCAEIRDAAGTPDDAASTTGGSADEGEAVDFSLTRSDNLCLPDEDAGGDPEGIDFNLAYQVVDGVLGAPCFGDRDETVEWAWNVLSDFVPQGQRRDLAVFGGFSTTEGEDNVTLAFVQPLDDEATDFLMAVNIAETRNDENEAKLTMAHELTHVFTALPTEIDRFTQPEDCETFDNGEGCYLPDSIMNQWFDRFWQDVESDPNDQGEAAARCSLDAGFFGEYAASNPEEDFAEAFSAYVMGVEAVTPGQQSRLDFIDAYPGLREFRDRALARGLGPLDNNFDACG
ncbi:MAG: hypothetical protein AAF567_00235 [Actinomycetota bacterium]